MKAAIGVICAATVGAVLLLPSGSHSGAGHPKADKVQAVYTPPAAQQQEAPSATQEKEISQAEPASHRSPDGHSNADAGSWAWPSGAIEDVDSFVAANADLVAAAARGGDRAAARMLGRLFAACFVDGRKLQSCKGIRAAAAPGEKSQWVNEAALASDRLAQVYYHDIVMGELREDDPAYGRKLHEINHASVRYLESAANVGGDGVAMFKLSYFYRSGYYVQRSVEKAYVYGLVGSWSVPHRRGMSAEQIEQHDSELARLRRELVDQERVPELRRLAHDLQRLAYEMRG